MQLLHVKQKKELFIHQQAYIFSLTPITHISKGPFFPLFHTFPCEDLSSSHHLFPAIFWQQSIQVKSSDEIPIPHVQKTLFLSPSRVCTRAHYIPMTLAIFSFLGFSCAFISMPHSSRGTGHLR
eukprot:TRINITY_DN40750_c0_g1_i1.p1 TRINITY_DN40750_c0_g1~~TRINITY_DN40750_c0_g1_i1.p1  ORF type:complete len:124 (-),score=4.98 TRINITY_DN40750_c0_g1_i1:136-507(-)